MGFYIQFVNTNKYIVQLIDDFTNLSENYNDLI